MTTLKAKFPCGISLPINEDQAKKIRFIQSCLKQNNLKK